MQLTFSPDALGSETPESILRKLRGYSFEVTLTEDGSDEDLETFVGELVNIELDAPSLLTFDLGKTRYMVGRNRIKEMKVL